MNSNRTLNSRIIFCSTIEISIGSLVMRQQYLQVVIRCQIAHQFAKCVIEQAMKSLRDYGPVRERNIERALEILSLASGNTRQRSVRVLSRYQSSVFYNQKSLHYPLIKSNCVSLHNQQFGKFPSNQQAEVNEFCVHTPLCNFVGYVLIHNYRDI